MAPCPPRAWSRAVLVAVVLAGLQGCQRPPAGHEIRPADAGSAAEAGDWLGFRPYPGARHLCTQFVDGFSNGKPSGGQWMSFASGESAASIATFYDAPATGDGGFEVNQGNRHLSVHPTGAKYPSCEVAPRSGEQTVIVVSQFYRAE